MPPFSSAARCAVLLSLVLTVSSAVAQVSIVERDNSAEDRIEAALAQRVSFAFDSVRLKDAIDSIELKTVLTTVLATKKLKEADIDLETPVTATFHDITLASCFRNILTGLELTIVIRNDVLIVTTTDDAASHLSTRTYPVLDLVARRMPAQESGAARNAGGSVGVADYESLIEVITTTLDPDSWDDVGGPGAVAEFPNAGVLVISQSREVHQRIGTLLNSLRRAKSVQGLPSIAPLAKTSTAVRTVERGTLGNRETAAANTARRRVATPQPSWLLPQVYEE